MKPDLALVWVIVISTALPCQISTTFKVGSGAYVYAFDGQSNQSLHLQIPADTDLKTGLSRSALAGRGSASLGVSFAESAKGIACQLQANASGTSGGSTTYSLGIASMPCSLTVTSTSSSRAVLRVTWEYWRSQKAVSLGGVSVGTTTVLNELANSQSHGSLIREFPLTIGGTPTVIGISLHSSGGWESPGSSNATLRVEVVPAACGSLKYGVACGLGLEGNCELEDRIELVVTGAQPSATGVLVVGSSLTSTPIPGSSCLLLTDPACVEVIRFSTAGTWAYRPRLPASRPVILAAQVGALGTTLATSNGLVLSVQR